jgi:hypothetical protein
MTPRHNPAKRADSTAAHLVRSIMLLEREARPMKDENRKADIDTNTAKYTVSVSGIIFC